MLNKKRADTKKYILQDYIECMNGKRQFITRKNREIATEKRVGWIYWKGEKRTSW